jgi:WD40 repeat protein/Flp pilus assembly protein TadD
MLRTISVPLLVFSLITSSPQAQPQPAPLTPEQQTRLKERNQLFAEAQKLRGEGKVADAVAAAQKMLDIERDVLGGDHKEVADSLAFLAGLHRQNDDLPNAKRVLTDLLALRTKLDGAKHWRTTDVRLDLTLIDTLAGMSDAARRRAKEADGLEKQAVQAGKAGRFRDALEPAQKCLEIRKQIFTNENRGVADLFNYLGYLHDSLKEYDRAEAYHRQALDIRRKLLGEEHPVYALSLNNLGFVYLDRGDFAKAEPLLKQTVEVRKKALGELHADYAESLLSLATLYRAKKDFKQALVLIFQAYDLTMKRVGKEEHPACARIANQAGIAFYGDKNYALAEKTFQRAHMILKQSLGKDHADTKNCLANLLAVYQRQLEQVRKQTPLDKLPEDAEGLYGSLPIYVNIARLHDERDDAAQARQTRETVLAIHEKIRALKHASGVRLSMQLGHSGMPRAVAFSPDDRWVVSVSGTDGGVLWEAATGREIRRFQRADTSREAPDSVAFSPDGRWLVTNGGGNAYVWEVGTGRELHSLEGHLKHVVSVAFSPNGRWVATCSRDKTARLWEAATGKEVRRLTGHTATINSVAFSPNGDQLITASFDKTVRIWDLASSKEIQTLTSGVSFCSAVFSPNGKRILTGGQDNTFRIWDPETGKELAQEKLGKAEAAGVTVAWSMNGPRIAAAWGIRVRLIDLSNGKWVEHDRFGSIIGEQYVIAFSHDGRFLAETGVKGVRLWDTASGKMVRELTGNSSGRVDAVSFSPKGRSIAVAGEDKTAWLWESHGPGIRRLPDGYWTETIEDGKQRQVWRGKSAYEGHASSVESLAYSPDGKWLLTGGMEHTFFSNGKPGAKAEAILWEVATGKPVKRFPTQAGITAVAFSPNGQTIAAALRLGVTVKKSIRLWKTATGEESFSFDSAFSQIDSIAFSPNGEWIMASGVAGSELITAVWSVATGKEVRRWGGFLSKGGAFLPDSETVLVRNKVGKAALHKVSTGEEVRCFEPPPDKSQVFYWMEALALSADGRRVAAIGKNGGAVWDAATGKLLVLIEGQFGRHLRAALSQDGRHLAIACSDDQRTRLWDAETGKELCQLFGFRDNTWAIVDPEGRYDSSNAGDISGLHWVAGNETIALDQLKERYYDPGLLDKLLGFNKESLREVAAFRDVKLYPDIALTQADAKKPQLDVTLTNRGGGIGRVVVLINGKELTHDARPRDASADAPKLSLQLDLAGDPRLVPGQKNTLEVLAYNADGYLSSRGIIREIDGPGKATVQAPTVHAVIVGVSEYRGSKLNLRYAAKDAEDFATALRLAAARLFGADKAHVTLLSTSRADTRPSRVALDQALGALKKTEPGDVIVVYLAGHGVMHGGSDGDWHYLTADALSADLADPEVRKQVSLSSAELTDLLKAAPARKQVLILDTCHSGRLVEKLTERRNVPGSQVRALQRVKDRTGTHVLAGCAADAVSYEASRYGQGLLTYSLLLAMRGAKLRDGEYVDVVDLFAFAADKVPELARDIGGVQRPTVASPRGTSFDIGRLTSEDRPRVPLQSVKPVVLRCSFQEEKRVRDRLGLTMRVNERLREASAAARGAKLVFVDAEDFPGALQAAGRYKAEGDRVTVSVTLFEGEKEAASFTIEGTAENLDELAAKVVAGVEKNLATRGGP